MKLYFDLLRFKQYSKNVFILLPIFFAQKITDLVLIKNSLLLFAGFSLVASAIYIFNDFIDLEEDKRHIKKRERPLASGRIQTKKAFQILVPILLTGLAIILYLGMNLFLLTLFYIFLNVSYSLKLKHIAIIDCFIIAGGFVIRIFLGGIIADIQLSMWIVLVTFLLALFLALSKRRDDLLIYQQSGKKVRKVIDGYSLDFVNVSMTIMATVTLVSYIMYSVSNEVVEKVQSQNLYITSFFVLLGILRYLQITLVYNQSGSPTEVLIKDRFLQLTIAGWIFSFVIILYL